MKKIEMRIDSTCGRSGKDTAHKGYQVGICKRPGQAVRSESVCQIACAINQYGAGIATLEKRKTFLKRILGLSHGNETDGWTKIRIFKKAQGVIRCAGMHDVSGPHRVQCISDIGGFDKTVDNYKALQNRIMPLVVHLG
ncbi:hypothetical protein [Actibacterium sp. 188UL27-1]|uniref:hypothetical protein n=1 Tax=Actibacterium sp. 188UL27-1 TaxID=2786961 RepID=UPI001958FC19|nr:hypothetical protein [Actibacterium sp. 188UL27-1]MBM7069920.1 hypothetical protein [Actibacterium sp. 188UL27-1]